MNLRAVHFYKPPVFIASLLPLALLVQGYVQDSLGANPIETITRGTGDWTLNFLLLSLAITPLRRLTHWQWPMRLRRMLGLFAFFYACLHFAIYIWLDQFFDWEGIFYDILDRPFITVGFLGFTLLIPLALTSTRGMMQRLGGKRWQGLHRLVYVSAIAGVLHYAWLVKADLQEPLIYAAILAVLLGFRVVMQQRKLRPQRHTKINRASARPPAG